MKTSLTRRDFVTTAGVGAMALTFTARSYARITGANDRIRIAQIGCGGAGGWRTWPACISTTRSRTPSLLP